MPLSTQWTDLLWAWLLMQLPSEQSRKRVKKLTVELFSVILRTASREEVHTVILIFHIFMNVNKLCLNQEVRLVARGQHDILLVFCR